MQQLSRTRHDPAAGYGYGFNDTLSLGVSGNLAAYVSGLDGQFVPLGFDTYRKGVALILTDIQAWYRTLGVGGSGNDTFLLRKIDQYSVDTAGAGTVSTTGTALTGSGTAFLTFFQVGSLIRSGTNTFKILAIADNTHATLEAAPAVDWSAAAYVKVPYNDVIGVITVPANSRYLAPVDLRTNLKGYPLKPGEGIRLDTGAIGTGYSTTPANIVLRCGVEGYGVVG